MNTIYLQLILKTTLNEASVRLAPRPLSPLSAAASVARLLIVSASLSCGDCSLPLSSAFSSSPARSRVAQGVHAALQQPPAKNQSHLDNLTVLNVMVGAGVLGGRKEAGAEAP